MSDDRARLDPRFDPAFQRGYDGAPPAAGSPGPAPAMAPQPMAPQPMAPPPSTPEPRTTPREDAGSPVGAGVTASAPRTLLTPDSFVADEPRRFNPWLITLGAVSVVLTLGGLLLITRLRDLFADTQNSAEFDYVVLQSLIIGAPILVGLGLATGIGLLFVLALRRAR